MGILRIRLGSRTFEPSWAMTLLTLAGVALFVGLGNWQWSKGNHRAQVESEFGKRGGIEDVGERDLSGVSRFQRVRVTGRWDTQHQFLLDNRTHEGRAGYEVLTPLIRGGDLPTVLVNRGWVPFSGFRDRLPDVSLTTDGDVQVVGRVDALPMRGLASGHSPPDVKAPWPKVTSFPDPGELVAALGRPLEGRILLLDPEEPDGYVRTWGPEGLPAIRHWSYGVQWYAFAVLALVLWVILGMRKNR